MKVAIGSTNPVKIAAAKLAFGKVWPKKKFKFENFKVDSGVSKQPMSDSEAIKGARNRAKEAIKAFAADFGVGLEGGLSKVNREWFDCGWVVVVNEQNKKGISSSLRMLTPKKMVKLVEKGLELGDVDDLLFKTKNSKQKEGHFGLMTKNALNRKNAYKDAVIAALTRFIHKDLF